MSDNSPSPEPPIDLPPLETQSNPNTLYKSPSPADLSSEDPLLRSVQSGQLASQDDSALSENGHPSSPSHSRQNSTMRGDGSALSVLNLLRGRGQVVGDDDDEDDEEMGGLGHGMPLGALRAPSGATGADMKKELRELHPYAQILGPADVASCVQLEQSAFHHDQAASPEKIKYRLNTCGELSLGIFSSVEPESPALKSPTSSSAQKVETTGSERRGVLLGAIVATKTQNPKIHDADMMIPDWYTAGEKPIKRGSGTGPNKGHDEAGRTIAVHSLAVVPEYQRIGLGRILVKSYVERVMTADVADRVAILAYQRLMPYYAKLGFEERGKSAVTFGGGGWVDMVLEFEGLRKKGDYDD